MQCTSCISKADPKVAQDTYTAKMKLLALVCLLGLAYGQKYPCCTKSKFEVFEFMQLFVAQRGQAVYKEVRRIAYV